MENQLITTDTFGYKVKRIFRSIFSIKRKSPEVMQTEEIVENNTEESTIDLDRVISCKTEAQVTDIKNQLAVKIIKNEITMEELAGEEVNEMIEYFEQEINNKNEEIKVLKSKIKELKEHKDC